MKASSNLIFIASFFLIRAQKYEIISESTRKSLKSNHSDRSIALAPMLT
jgi:hypothetical protein